MNNTKLSICFQKPSKLRNIFSKIPQKNQLCLSSAVTKSFVFMDPEVLYPTLYVCIRTYKCIYLYVYVTYNVYI